MVCLLLNVWLCVFEWMEDYNILWLLVVGLCVIVNFDDFMYFGGYFNDNYFVFDYVFGLNCV